MNLQHGLQRGDGADGAPARPHVRRLASSGLTLIELVLVITLMGIITSVAIWRMAPAVEHARVRRAASIMAADLQYAQMIAARSRQPVIVAVNASLRMYFVRARDTTIVFRQRFIGPDTDYGVGTVAAAPVGSVEVFPNGVATQGITVTLGLNGYTRQVRLSRAGTVRVVAP